MPLPTMDISSMNMTFSSFHGFLMVFSLSLSSAQYSKPLLAGILKSLSVGADLTTFTSSGFSPVTLFRYLISASYKSFVKVLLPTLAPPLKNNLRGSSLVLIECKTC